MGFSSFTMCLTNKKGHQLLGVPFLSDVLVGLHVAHHLDHAVRGDLQQRFVDGDHRHCAHGARVARETGIKLMPVFSLLVLHRFKPVPLCSLRVLHVIHLRHELVDFPDVEPVQRVVHPWLIADVLPVIAHIVGGVAHANEPDLVQVALEVPPHFAVARQLPFTHCHLVLPLLVCAGTAWSARYMMFWRS